MLPLIGICDDKWHSVVCPARQAEVVSAGPNSRKWWDASMGESLPIVVHNRYTPAHLRRYLWFAIHLVPSVGYSVTHLGPPHLLIPATCLRLSVVSLDRPHCWLSGKVFLPFLPSLIPHRTVILCPYLFVHCWFILIIYLLSPSRVRLPGGRDGMSTHWLVLGHWGP